jgi:hypothetical protein
MTGELVHVDEDVDESVCNVHAHVQQIKQLLYQSEMAPQKYPFYIPLEVNSGPTKRTSALLDGQDASCRSLSSRDRSDGRENSNFGLASGAGKRYRRAFCHLAPRCELLAPPGRFEAITIESRAFRRAAVPGSSPV